MGSRRFKSGCAGGAAGHWRQRASVRPRHRPVVERTVAAGAKTSWFSHFTTDSELLLFGGFLAANGEPLGASRDVLRADRGWLVAGRHLAFGSVGNCRGHGGELVHLAGGRADRTNANWGDQRDIAVHQVFDSRTGRTTAAAPLPMARNSAASFVIDGRWHVVGGRTVGGGNSARHDVYDFDDDAWRDAAPLPQAQGGLAAASIGNNGYVFGGEYFSPDGGGVYSEVWEYDAGQIVGVMQAGMPVPRHGLGAVTVGAGIYVVAGATGLAAPARRIDCPCLRRERRGRWPPAGLQASGLGHKP